MEFASTDFRTDDENASYNEYTLFDTVFIDANFRIFLSSSPQDFNTIVYFQLLKFDYLLSNQE